MLIRYVYDHDLDLFGLTLFVCFDDYDDDDLMEIWTVESQVETDGVEADLEGAQGSAEGSSYVMQCRYTNIRVRI